MKYRWVKLNIYSLLLTVFLIISGYGIYKILNIKWIAYPLCIIWGIFLVFTINVYMRYPHKVKILTKLVKKGKEKFDYRLFYPLFDSPCMRSVVYFTLIELKHSHEYWIIKKKAFSPDEKIEKSYSVFLKYENGMTKFYRKDHLTGIVYEIEHEDVLDI